MYIADYTLEQWLKEDTPYYDLTTTTLGIEGHTGILEFRTRESMVICGTEEVARMAAKLGLEVLERVSSGATLPEGMVFMRISGKAEGLHMLWKVALNLFEYFSGIATRANRFVEAAKQVSPNITVATTRKTMPGTKEMTVKAVLCGGAVIHRLGLSETILIFKQHRNFFDSEQAFMETLQGLRCKAPEKKIIVEVEREDQALMFAQADIDGIQYDKFSAESLRRLVSKVRSINRNLIHLAAGGINLDNVRTYADTGVDVLVTTAVYFGRPADIGAMIVKA